MKVCKALFLLGLFFAKTQSIGEVLTTSHVEKIDQGQKIKNVKSKEHFCSEGIQKVKYEAQSSNACESGNFST